MPHRPALALFMLALPALALQAAGTPPAMPAAKPYAAVDRVDLTKLLAPPPDEAGTRKELDELRGIQKSRTAADEAACIHDQVISVFRFDDVLGSRFTPENLPKTNALFLRVVASVHVPMQKAQDYWTRKRPPAEDPAIKPVGAVPATAAYPSGHATNGNLFGILLADMLPERAGEMRARGALFGYRRLLAGVHYPSDVEAGKKSAAFIAKNLEEDPEFQADFAAARDELRTALGQKAAPKTVRDGDGGDDDGAYRPKKMAPPDEAKEY
jgi:acid phosphatase (class A)